MGYSNEDLNDTGLAQVKRLSTRLAVLDIATVYSSPLQRANSTAREIARPHGLKVRANENLTEINLGEWQGLHTSEVRQKWPDLWLQWREDPSQLALPGGESFRQIARRVSQGFKTVLLENPGVNSIIVSHEVVIKIIIMQVLGVSYNVYRKFEIANASLSSILVRNNNLRLISLNDKAHLEGLG